MCPSTAILDKSQFLELELTKRYLLKDSLRSYDPYDIWKTSLGSLIKRKYYSNKLASLFAGGLTVFDLFLNNRMRLFYNKQEYAVVRAFATLILHNVYRIEKKEIYHDFALNNTEWLIKNLQKTNRGIGWGLGFRHPVSRQTIYPPTAAFSTITPYVLEALIDYEKLFNQKGVFEKQLKKIYNFFTEDLEILHETSTYQITSYGTLKDRKVVNAVSYTLYSILYLADYLNETTTGKVVPQKLYNYILEMQNADGSWYYSEEGKSFIDCFHSCIIIKNLIKSRQFMDIDASVIEKGYNYIKNNFYDPKTNLYKRFTISNKPGLIKYDLYDNSEMLNLAILMEDKEEACKLSASIEAHFVSGEDIFSAIDTFGFKRNKNMLRWAIMPFLFALSNYTLKYETADY